jgi:hypothetical protein
MRKLGEVHQETWEIGHSPNPLVLVIEQDGSGFSLERTLDDLESEIELSIQEAQELVKALTKALDNTPEVKPEAAG